jgi:Putative peptidoglycan binding domain
MKYIFTSISLGLALAVSAVAQVRNQGDTGNVTTRVHRNAGASTSTVAPATTTRGVSQPRMAQRNVSATPMRQRSYARTPRTNATVRSDVSANTRFRDRNFRTNDQARVRSNVSVNRERNFRDRTRSANARTDVAVNRNRNLNVNRERSFAGNRNRNVGFTQRSNVNINRNRNVVVTNNWRGSQFSGRQYAAFRNYHRTWHDRDWWRSHYSNIVFVDGGWWYWNAGYWFPAWGYAASAYYPYDGPIYGYSNLSPDQVVVNVQTQLARDGYYNGPIDGVLGPMTRQAIAAFQADNGLAITSTVDEPTLDTLGLS